MKMKKQIEMKLALEHKQVCLRELNCAKGDFDRYFRCINEVTNNLDPIDGTVRGVTWESLSGLIPNVDPPAGSEYGVRFHCGMPESEEDRHLLVYAAEVVLLTPRSGEILFDVAPTNSIVHAIDMAQGIFDGGSEIDTWIGKNRERDTYFSRVHVCRNWDSTRVSGPEQNSNFDKLISGYDNESYTFKWKDIETLHAHNQSEGDHVLIYALAVPKIRGEEFEEDWRHVLALVMSTGLNENNALINDDPSNPEALFRNKALDLGSPCPPSCNIARFYHYGLAPRSGCSC